MASEYGSATWKISLWLCNDQGASLVDWDEITSDIKGDDFDEDEEK